MIAINHKTFNQPKVEIAAKHGSVSTNKQNYMQSDNLNLKLPIVNSNLNIAFSKSKSHLPHQIKSKPNAINTSTTSNIRLE